MLLLSLLLSYLNAMFVESVIYIERDIRKMLKLWKDDILELFN